MARRNAHRMRMQFLRALGQGLYVTWPILSVLLMLQVTGGLLIGWLEGWSLPNGVYFAFVTGLTVGYGDLVPSLPASRLLAVGIAFTGILVTGMFAALGVRALQAVTPEEWPPGS